MSFYLDTSALVKLVVHEPETDGLRDWLAETPRDPVVSDLARTELLRAVRRVAPELLVLDALTITEVTTAVFEAAGRLDPSILRTLDAIHVAAALDLGDDLEGMVTYDERLAQAAQQNGILVAAPT